MTREDLIDAAKDLNKILGLEPPIDAMWETEEIRESIIQAGSLVDITDKLKDKTWRILLGAKGLPKELEKSIRHRLFQNHPSVAFVEKPSFEKKRKKEKKSLEYREFLYSLILEGKYTRDEIIERMKDKYPSYSSSYIRGIISDGKNPKYNPFKELILEEKGILSFKR